jgi:hypothetical protein
MQIVFLKQFKKASSLKNTILKEFKPKGKDNANEFYINIDRRLVKIEMASVNIVQAKGDIFISKPKIEIMLFTQH